MQYELQEFNLRCPKGTKVLWFPLGDQLPIFTTKTTSEAEIKKGRGCGICVKLEASEHMHPLAQWVPIDNIFTVNDNQLQEIFRILEGG